MLCDHLEGWDREGGRETQEGRDMGIYVFIELIHFGFFFVVFSDLFIFLDWDIFETPNTMLGIFFFFSHTHTVFYFYKR